MALVLSLTGMGGQWLLVLEWFLFCWGWARVGLFLTEVETASTDDDCDGV